MAALPDDFVPVTAAPRPELPDDLIPAAPQRQPIPLDTSNMMGDPTDMALVHQAVGPILDNFGRGFRERYGEAPLGLSPESMKFINKAAPGLLASETKEGQFEYKYPTQAFADLLAHAIVATPELTYRGTMGVFGGIGAVAEGLGAHRDIAGMVSGEWLPFELGGMLHAPERPVLAIPKQAVEERVMPKIPPQIDKIAESIYRDIDRGEIEMPPHGTPEYEDAFQALYMARQEGAAEPGEAPGARPLGGKTDEELRHMVERATGELPPASNLNIRGVTIDEPRSATIIDLGEARSLGVIGEQRPPVSEGTPSEAATRTVAATRSGDDVLRGSEAEPPQNPWQERFEQFVSKLEAPDDVKQLIRDAAKENNDFLPARQGAIPLAHVEDIAAAAGVDAGEINQRGLGRTLRNDNEVRVAMQLMLQASENVNESARNVRADGSPENLIKLQESIMRRDLAVEQVVGLRAEWGRTGNVFQEFQRNVKDQEGLSEFLKGKGRTPDDLRKIADTISGLNNNEQVARLLNDMRTPSAWDKLIWYWVNALISGPVTHTKYILANAAFAGTEAGLVAPVAGLSGMVRRGVFGGHEGVFMGESGSRLWGIVAGTPDALVAAARAARTGLQTPLPGEVAQGILPKQNIAIGAVGQPIKGPIGLAIGLPARGASAIHSFFNFLGYRASMEAQAYRAAAKEGLKVGDDDFWQHRQAAVDSPTPEMMNEAIDEGYRLTYINELGPAGKAISKAVKATKVGQLVLPFLHIPFNILGRATEYVLGLNFVTADARGDLLGKNGAVKQDMAVARLVVGSATGAWAMNMVLNDRMTGYGPTDDTERRQWLETKHQPYSVRIGDEWYSFNRFGSLGTMLGLYSNLAEVIPHMKQDSEELTKALTMTVHSTGRLLEDEVGMQGLAGLIEAINEPDRRGARFVSSFAGSFLPYSSALRQVASADDPYMRETKSVVDGLRYYIPGMRESLFPKRNFLGEPIANAGYGFDLPYLPSASAVIQHRQATPDPIALEMQRFNLRPAAPQDRISGIKLTPELYDRYQTVAGTMARQQLEWWQSRPGWNNLPPVIREEAFKSSIKQAHEAAAAMMQVANPAIIQQGYENAVARINGGKQVKKLKE